MEGFKQFKKVQCFKEGGTVQRKIENFEKRERKVEEKDDMAQDKKVVKKAFSIHDKQQHEEKTDLSKLRKGGRAKKEKGTVKKFACGGGVYGAKKTKEDIKSIDAAKNCKPKKLAKGGKSVKKMADGRLTGALGAGALGAGMGGMAGMVQDQERKKRIAKYLGPAQQAQMAAQQAQATAAQPPNAAAMTAAPPQDQMGAPTGMPMQKRGGKVCK